MKIKLLGSSVQDTAKRQYVSSYVIDGRVAIDVGCLGFYGTPQEQESIRHVFLTHTHADHTASLPIFVENAWTPREDCPQIYGSNETLDGVQKHIFNEVMWPNFIDLSRKMSPFLRLCPIEAESPVKADRLEVTAVNVNHVVPTFGYVVSDGKCAVIFGGDSGPTDRLWEIARQTENLRAVFLEACFPNSLTSLANASLHLTPEMFGREVAKMPRDVHVVAVHIKVRYREQVIRELQALELPHLIIAECEKEYEF
jgi:ribonuclease BN (tRNA processing enzyme)